MLPLLNVMVDQLRQFIAGDLPFLPVEREQRLRRLEQLLDRADVSVAENIARFFRPIWLKLGMGARLKPTAGATLPSFHLPWWNWLVVPVWKNPTPLARDVVSGMLIFCAWAGRPFTTRA